MRGFRPFGLVLSLSVAVVVVDMNGLRSARIVELEQFGVRNNRVAGAGTYNFTFATLTDTLFTPTARDYTLLNTHRLYAVQHIVPLLSNGLAHRHDSRHHWLRDGNRRLLLHHHHRLSDHRRHDWLRDHKVCWRLHRCLCSIHKRVAHS